MWPFNRKFNHNPEDFRLKIVESWFSENFIEFRYSDNGGQSWKKIYYAKEPLLNRIDHDWEWKTLTYKLGSGDFSTEKKRFSSYQKILDYHKEQEEKYKKGQESHERKRKIEEEERLKALKRANN